VVAPPGFEPTIVFGPYDRNSRRAQLSVRHGDRNYDRIITRLGTGKVQRYLASDFDRLSDRLLDASEIAVVEVVETSGWQRGTARAQSVQHCSTELRKNGRGEFT
jgi:hypothetical protein